MGEKKQGKGTKQEEANSEVGKLGSFHKGRIGEDILRLAFRLRGYQVIPLGIENTPALTGNDAYIWNNPLFQIFRHAPDFLVVKRFQERFEYLFIEAKCWPAVRSDNKLFDEVRKVAVGKYLGKPVDADGNPLKDVSGKSIKDNLKELDKLVERHHAMDKTIPVMADIRFMVIANGDLHLFRLGNIVFVCKGKKGKKGAKEFKGSRLTTPWQSFRDNLDFEDHELKYKDSSEPRCPKWFEKDFEAIRSFIKSNYAEIKAGCDLCEQDGSHRSDHEACAEVGSVDGSPFLAGKDAG
jgi:hypothetical protein